MSTEVTSYTELMAGIQAQVGALGLKLTDFDDLAGFPAGLSGKVFGMLQVKRLGPEKMFDAIRAAGLRLRLEVDPDQEAKMKQRITENYNPRQANQARPQHSSSPVGTAVMSRVFKPLARKGGKAKFAKMKPDELRKYQQAAINARWKKYRKIKKAAHRRRIKERKSAATPDNHVTGNVLVATYPVVDSGVQAAYRHPGADLAGQQAPQQDRDEIAV